MAAIPALSGAVEPGILAAQSMRTLRTVLIPTVAPVLLAAAASSAPAAPDGDDDALPEPVSAEHFEAVLEHSPFLRILDPSETFSLRGVAVIGDETVATLYNRDTKQTIRVTESAAAPKPAEPRLVDVTESPDLTAVSVRIAVEGETVELFYEPERVTPAPSESSKYRHKHYDVKFDSKGHAIPPEDLIKKYHSLSDKQRDLYRKWRDAYYAKHPDIRDSEKRFPIVDRVIDTIKAGKTPPRP